MSWSVLGESVIGTAHGGRNIPCQDAFRFRLFGPMEEWLVVALADGAGSASHSDVGATRARDELVHRVEVLDSIGLFSREGMTDLLGDVRSVLVAEAEQLGLSPRELACTTLLAIIGPSSAVLAQLGDGAIVLGNGQGYRVAFWPE